MTTTITDRLDTFASLTHETIAVLRDLGVPGDRVHSVNVAGWASSGFVVSVQISGNDDTARELVDRIGDHYGLAADDGESSNYQRGDSFHGPVSVFCGRGES